MLGSINQPRGILGALSVAACALLVLGGLVGSLVMLTDPSGDEVEFNAIWFVVALVQIVGAVGFAITHRSPVLGGALGAAGGLALGAWFFWALVPLAIGPAIAGLAVLRAIKLNGRERVVAPA